MVLGYGLEVVGMDVDTYDRLQWAKRFDSHR
jgi:hypothetical protein